MEFKFFKQRKFSAGLWILLIGSVVVCFGINGASPLIVPTPASPTPKTDLEILAPLEQMGKAFAFIAAKVKPAVVSVFSEKMIKFRPEDLPFGDDLLREFFGLQKMPGNQQQRSQHPREYKIPQMGMGSGIILDHQGHILTNFHVVQNVDDIKVLLPNQRILKAKVIGKDAKTDVAIIQVPATGLEDIPPIQWGDSEALQVGDIVLAIGAPFGLTQTVTHGIISAKGRADVGLADYEDFLQTDAPINPGNSGGPLVSGRGEIIGMNSAIATSIGQSGGVGFAIPSNMIKAMLPKIIKGEAIVRGELGLGIQNLTEDLALHFGAKEAKGVLITQVTPGTTAEKAGLKVGDIITSYEGKPVDDARVLRNLVAGSTPGSKVKMELLRNKKNKTITVTIAHQESEETEERPKNSEPPGVLNGLGLVIETLTKDLALRLNLKETTGVIILDIEEGGPAALAGLQIGDVIIEVNHKAVKNAATLAKIISQTKEKTLLMLVKRQGTNLFINLNLD
ncbi:MAG: Do family serine endopeptidase [Pseudobdellovibrionaceae bacterium]